VVAEKGCRKSFGEQLFLPESRERVERRNVYENPCNANKES
jgi:hypothetical protein